MKYKLLIILLLSTISGYAQLKITGRVVDEKTNEPIPNASIYLNNSSCGTGTDADGKFILTCPTSGKAQIVISHIIYEKKVHIVEAGQSGDLLIKLKLQPNTLNEVVIKAKGNSQEDITRWLNLFTLNLIGKYNRSHMGSKIKNAQDLYFNFDRSENKLSVYTKGPLIIENDFLGYDIRIDLDKFEYSFNTNVVDYSYSCLYENMKQKKLPENQLIANRKLAYEGSTLHFMRSVFRNNLSAEYFTIAKYTAVRNKEKDRVNAIITQKVAEAYAKETVPVITLAKFFPRDTAKYYQAVMGQNNILDSKVTPIELEEITKKSKETRTVNLNFVDTIQVTYEKTKLNSQQHQAAALGKNKDNPRVIKPVYLASYLYFFKDEGINIQQNGYYAENSIFMYGDMPERRIGMSVPINFDPDNPLQ